MSSSIPFPLPLPSPSSSPSLKSVKRGIGVDESVASNNNKTNNISGNSKKKNNNNASNSSANPGVSRAGRSNVGGGGGVGGAEVESGEGWNVKFVPLASNVESSFWVRYCQEKLETIQLDERAVDIEAYYTVDEHHPRLQCREGSLYASSPSSGFLGSAAAMSHRSNDMIAMAGQLIGYNTVETFQGIDKNQLLREFFLPSFLRGELSSLTSILLLTFPDLKSHRVLYWFAVPTFMIQPGRTSIRAYHQVKLRDVWSPEECDHFAQEWMELRRKQEETMRIAAASSSTCPPYFLWVEGKCWPLLAKDDFLERNSGSVGGAASASSASADRNSSSAHHNIVFGFVDPTRTSANKEQQPMGWPLRNLIAYLCFHWDLGGQTVSILSYRPKPCLQRVAVATPDAAVPEKEQQQEQEQEAKGESPDTTAPTTPVEGGEQQKQQQHTAASAMILEDVGSSILLQVGVPFKEDYGYPSSSSKQQAKDQNEDTTTSSTVDEPATTATVTAKTTKTTTTATSISSKGTDLLKVVGWELNTRSKPGPRWVNLQPLIDPSHLAIQAADLNLKLMKWRMIPSLQIDRLKATKVLLIGAGTLGCNVARVLLGWGIRKFQLVDYGKVSYSNPVRQSLFTMQDCQDRGGNNASGGGTGKSKAMAAAAALRTIAADVESHGIVLSIPMPGHPEPREVIQSAVEALDGMIRHADVVYLLTDTRESRWLPTVIAAAHDKMLINAALGLETWLVMRHGAGPGKGAAGTGAANGDRLGCYYCNEVVAPENSMKNRTLDQQCTVTRPGLSLIASAMAGELTVSLLHHPLRQAAPAMQPLATKNAATADDDHKKTSAPAAETSPLGTMPHQIRGSIASYAMMTPTVPAFRYCTACSVPVVEAYRRDGVQLMWDVCQSTDGRYLEDLSGLTAFQAEAAEKVASLIGEDGEDDIGWDDDE